MPNVGNRENPWISPWQAVPWLLRVAALYGLCLVVLAAALYVVGRLVISVAGVSLAVAVALLLAALMHPVTGLLRRLRLPASLAALGGVLTMLGFLTLVGTVVANQVAGQFTEFGETISGGVGDIRQAILAGPIPISGERLDATFQSMRKWVSDAPADPAATASGTAEVLGSALLALVLVFFFLKDGARMWGWFLRLFPERLRPAIGEAGRDGWWTLSRYIGGQVIVAAVDAIGIGAALAVIGVPLVAPLMLLTFVGGFVPIIGATAAGAAAALVALVSNGPTDALLVLAAVIAVQQLEGNLLEPLIVGRAIKLHPVPVLLAVTAGALTAGIAGAVIAVPVLAVLYRSGKVLLRHRAVQREADEAVQQERDAVAQRAAAAAVRRAADVTPRRDGTGVIRRTDGAAVRRNPFPSASRRRRGTRNAESPRWASIVVDSNGGQRSRYRGMSPARDRDG